MATVYDSHLGVYIASELRYNTILVTSNRSEAMEFASKQDAEDFMSRLNLTHERFEAR